jgi:hypothetical protein
MPPLKFNDLDIHAVGDTTQMVGVIYQDAKDGRYLALPFPREAAGFMTKDGFSVLEMTLPEWEKFIEQTDRVEVRATVQEEDGTVLKAFVMKSARQISQETSWAVYRRDRYRCVYCGNGEVPLTVDHLVLWQDGGPSTEANLVTACKKCNRTRGETPYATWLKSDYYKRVSQNLPPAIQERNERLLTTLHTIPKHPLKGMRSRR